MWGEIDPYVLVEVLKFLDWDHLFPVSLVCRHWLSISRDPLLRKHLGIFDKELSDLRFLSFSRRGQGVIVARGG